ncbi:HEC/Ndc80p family-domain-containing protein [Tribonema minus]|uniref:Kinetochore protein NDC80 n=1 Tax=Tribonema minus TaxID=303371 RepID=A0A836CEN5_9STRA|nr:HEC/Ndc80p family-domain-containing protein [Tribonema minus]
MAAPGRMSLNVGNAMGRGTAAPPPRASLAAVRHSLAAPGGRKSSVGMKRSSNFGTAAIKTDPRPITDKNFRNDSIRALVNYLADYGYDQPISAKILTRPSGRDFNNIMGFLFRQFDPAWQPSPGARFEDEVIPFLKSIHYPFTLSKSLLQAVGAPQSWPKALAAISWIVELLMYDKEVAAYESEQQDRRLAGEVDIADHAFFEYLGQAYACFLNGDETSLTALEQDLVGTFGHQNQLIGAEAQTRQARNAALREATERILSRAGALPELRQRQRDCASDLEKFRLLIAQLDGHRDALVEKVEKRAAEEERAKGDLGGVREQIAALRERVANQELSAERMALSNELSAEDVQRMALERQRLRDGMLAAAEHKSAAQKRGWEAEMQLSRRLEALENAVHTCNSKAQALQLVPAAAKNANGQDYELGINRHSLEDEENVLSNDVRGHIRPALAAMRDAVVRRMQEAREQLLELLDAQEASEEQLSEQVDAHAALESRVKRSEDAYRREKDALDAHMAAKATQASALERRLCSARDPQGAAARATAARARAAALRGEMQAARAAAAAASAATKQEIHEALVVCWDFQDGAKGALAELRAQGEGALSAVAGCGAVERLWELSAERAEE